MFKLPIFEHFLSVGSLKRKFKWFFEPKLKPKCYLLNCSPDAVNSIAADNTATEEADQNTSSNDQNEPSSAPEGTSAAPGTSGAAGTSAEMRTKANTKPCDECGKDVQKNNYSRYKVKG